MPLSVLYVEDNEKHKESLERALKESNRNKPEWAKIFLDHAPDPEFLLQGLKKNPDVVLADVYFKSHDDPKGQTGPPRIKEIIELVNESDKNSKFGFPTPIIAYTGKGKQSLLECLNYRNSLYDIWNKLSIGPEYAAWRFTKLSTELRRNRPDATLQKLIISMSENHCPPWHKYVLGLIKNYGSGQSEYEQILNCRSQLQFIFDTFNSPGKHTVNLMKLWDVLSESEPLLRSVIPSVRGIARHSINVFWLGYWLINNDKLHDVFMDLWLKAVNKRPDFDELKKTDPIVGFNAVWLLASLFHDSGKLLEYGKAITTKISEYINEIKPIDTGIPLWNHKNFEKIPQNLLDLLHVMGKKHDDPLTIWLKKHIITSFNSGKPDHGAVAAAYLLNIGAKQPMKNLFGNFSIEAARAVLLHSCLPYHFHIASKNDDEDILEINWRMIRLLAFFCYAIKSRHGTDIIQKSRIKITRREPTKKPEPEQGGTRSIFRE